MRQTEVRRAVISHRRRRPHSLRCAVGTGVAAVRRAIIAASARLLPHRKVDGLELVAFSGHGDHADAFDRLTRALALLKHYAPRRYGRMRRDMRRIALAAKGGELYDHDIRTYLVDTRVLMRRSVEEIAMAIVHEATHARLRSRGVEVTAGNRTRIEWLCVSEEIDFAGRLPAHDHLVEHARRKLQEPWWSDDERERRIEDQLDALGLPRWLIRIRRGLHRGSASSATRPDDECQQPSGTRDSPRV